MNQNWRTYKLGDIGDFFGGVTSIKKEDYGFGTPFIPYKNVYKNSKIDVGDLELMNVNQNDLKKRNAIYGDIFFTASSETPDEVAISSVLLDNIENLTYNGFCKRLRLKDFETLLPEFARYYFQSDEFRTQVYQLKTGDVRFNISQESLAKINITIPNITEQKRIAEILTSLDDKIELNNQMNKTLESIAQTIFKEWFVDFNFPGFDGELVDGLPKGWRMGKLKEFISIKHGFAFKGEFFSDFETDHILLTPGNFKIGGGFNYQKKKFYSGPIPKIYICDYNDLIVTMTDLSKASDTLGYPALVPKIYDKKLLHNQRIGKVVITDNNIFYKSWLYMLLRQTNYRHYIIGSATGSTVKHTSPSKICDFENVLPDEHILKLFDDKINSLLLKQSENEYENQVLTKLRDSLLPKLISGKININQMQ